MELYEYIKIFKRYKRTVIVVAFLGLATGAFISIIRSSQYEASFSMIIRPKILEKTEDFKLVDAIDASDRVTRMTENWLTDQKMNVRTKRLGNQIVKISLDEQNEKAAREGAKRIQEKSNAFIASLSPTRELGSFEAVSRDFSFSKKNPYWTASLFAGFFGGLVLGLFVALFRHYLER